MSDVEKDSNTGYLLLLLPILGWGLAPNMVEIGLGFIDALPFLTYRFLSAAIIMTPYIILKKLDQVKLLMRNKWSWIIGLSQAWAIVFQYLSQLYILPSLSAIIAYSYMILVPLVSVIVLNENLNKKHIPVVGLAAIGLVMIATEGGYNAFNSSGMGIFFAFLSTWGFAFYITSTSRLTTKSNLDVDSFALFYIVMLIVTVAGFTLSLIFQPNLVVTSSQAWLSILLLTFVSTIVAYIAYIESLKYITANTASVLLLLQIVIPFIIDFAFYGRTYSIWILFGSILIFIASFFAVKFHDHQ